MRSSDWSADVCYADHCGKLNVHEDQIRAVLAGDFQRIDAVARLKRLIAMRVEKIMEELHVQLIVFDDQNLLGHRIHAPELHLLPSPSGASILVISGFGADSRASLSPYHPNIVN